MLMLIFLTNTLQHAFCMKQREIPEFTQILLFFEVCRVYNICKMSMFEILFSRDFARSQKRTMLLRTILPEK